jgi:hypothetical protein
MQEIVPDSYTHISTDFTNTLVVASMVDAQVAFSSPVCLGFRLQNEPYSFICFLFFFFLSFLLSYVQ